MVLLSRPCGLEGKRLSAIVSKCCRQKYTSPCIFRVRVLRRICLCVLVVVVLVCDVVDRMMHVEFGVTLLGLVGANVVDLLGELVRGGCASCVGRISVCVCVFAKCLSAICSLLLVVCFVVVRVQQVHTCVACVWCVFYVQLGLSASEVMRVGWSLTHK